MVQHPMPTKLDAETASHLAIRAVASDEISRFDVLALAALKIDDVRCHTVVGRFERFEPTAVPQIDVGKRAGTVLQYRIEPHLRTDLLPHWAISFRFCHTRRHSQAAEFVTGKCRYESHIKGIVRREWAFVHVFCYAPSPAEFHRADVDLVHLRAGDRAVTLLNERAGNAAPSKLDREGEPDRPTPDY